MAFTYTRERFECVAPDGSSLNYSMGADRASAEAFLARMQERGQYADGRLVRHVEEREHPAYMQVILQAVADGLVPESAVALVASDMQRMLNMTADAGRPSDAARSAVRAYVNGTLTEESFAVSRPTGFYPDDTNA